MGLGPSTSPMGNAHGWICGSKHAHYVLPYRLKLVGLDYCVMKVMCLFAFACVHCSSEISAVERPFSTDDIRGSSAVFYCDPKIERC